MRTTLLGLPAAQIDFRAVRQPASSNHGAYVAIKLTAYPPNIGTMMSVPSARILLLELQAAIAAAEVLEAGPEVPK